MYRAVIQEGSKDNTEVTITNLKYIGQNTRSLHSVRFYGAYLQTP